MPPKRKATKRATGKAAAKERPAQKARTENEEEDPPVPAAVPSSTAGAVLSEENPQADAAASELSKTKKMIANISKLHDPNDEAGVETALEELEDGPFKVGCHDETDWAETFASAIGAGIFPAVVAAMTNFPDSKEIVEMSITVFVQLIYKPTDAKWLRILIDLDAIGTVLRGMMKLQDKEDVMSEGCCFLINAIAHLEESALAQVNEVDGFIELFIQALDSHRDNEGIQDSGCALIHCLIEEDKDNKYDMRSKMKKARAMSKIVQAMEIHAEHPGVQEWGKKAMESLLA